MLTGVASTRRIRLDLRNVFFRHATGNGMLRPVSRLLRRLSLSWQGASPLDETGWRQLVAASSASVPGCQRKLANRLYICCRILMIATFPDETDGQCPACAHHRRVSSARGSVFLLCRRAARDSSFERYPALPVQNCQGYEPLSVENTEQAG